MGCGWKMPAVPLTMAIPGLDICRLLVLPPRPMPDCELRQQLLVSS
jgi:hypothetical protein